MTDSTYLGFTVAVVLLALVTTGALYRSQLAHWVLEGPTDERIATAQEHLEATLGVIAERVPQLAGTIADLERTDPLTRTDAMDRDTGRERVFWQESTPQGFQDLTPAQDAFVNAVIPQGFEPGIPYGVSQGHVLTSDGYNFDLSPKFAALPTYTSGPAKTPLDPDVPAGEYTRAVGETSVDHHPWLTPARIGSLRQMRHR